MLLHCCCAPCALGVIERVIKHFKVTLFWYNPNIMPQEEHEKRLEELKRVADIFGLPLVQTEYRAQDYFSCVKGLEGEKEGGARCVVCQKLRISAAEEYEKRLRAYCNFRLLELPECRLPENPTAAEIQAGLAKEAEEMLATAKRTISLSVIFESPSFSAFALHIARYARSCVASKLAIMVS